VSATIANTGRAAATEVVQLYTRDLVGSTTRPVRELKRFQRISLKPGQSQRVSFTLRSRDLAFHNPAMQQVAEPGDFKVWVAPNADAGLEGAFTLR